MNNIRWIAQRNKYSCGPIAILNVMKWAGLQVNYKKDYKFLSQKCRCTKDGTHQYSFQKCLDNIKNTSVLQKNLPTIASIEESIESKSIVVMKSSYLLRPKKVEGHFFIISEMTDDQFFCVNVYGRHEWYNKYIFAQHYLQYHKAYCEVCGTSNLCGVSPYAWFIKKKM